MNALDWTQPRFILAALIVAVLGGWLLLTVPIGCHYRSKIKSLRPGDVEKITFEPRAPVQGQPIEPGIVLTEPEVREFLGLLAESHFYFPSHPKGGWTRFARIKTKTKTYYLPIHASSNNGTLVWVFSGGTDGWNYGTLRNDKLKPFIEGVFSRSLGTNNPSLSSRAQN